MILAISVLSYVQSNMATNGQHFPKGTFWYILDMLFRRIQTYYCKKKNQITILSRSNHWLTGLLQFVINHAKMIEWRFRRRTEKSTCKHTDINTPYDNLKRRTVIGEEWWHGLSLLEDIKTLKLTFSKNLVRVI